MNLMVQEKMTLEIQIKPIEENNYNISLEDYIDIISDLYKCQGSLEQSVQVLNIISNYNLECKIE